MHYVDENGAEQAINRIALEIEAVDEELDETQEEVDQLAERIGTATLITGNQYRLGL